MRAAVRVMVLVVRALGAGGCGSSEPPAPPALPTTFGPSSTTVDLMPGRDIAPGLYRTSAAGVTQCIVDSPEFPQRDDVPPKYRPTGVDGYPVGTLVPRMEPEFMVRSGYRVEFSGPCVWTKA